jgi:FMN phosphatase YigB (HAD superfamily)
LLFDFVVGVAFDLTARPNAVTGRAADMLLAPLDSRNFAESDYRLRARLRGGKAGGWRERCVHADPVLRELLQRLPYKKVIFTNCREEEANRILDLLGVRDCFNATYGATFLGEICKPEEACFEKLLTTLELRAGEVLYFEDSVKNLRTADKLGMPCVLVHSETASEEGAQIDRERSVGHVEGFDNPVVVVDTLNDGGRQLRAALPRLFHTVLE